MSDAPTGRAAVRWCPDADTNAPCTLARVRFIADAQVDNCPLRWLGGDFSHECWRIDSGTIRRGETQGWHYAYHPQLAFAALHIDDGGREAMPDAIQQAARDAYRCLFALQRELGLPCVQRVWHWLSEPTTGAGDDERYQRFCRGRAEAMDAPEATLDPLPPATLVAGDRRGLRMHVLLGNQPVQPIENPRQISAYRYPRDYGIRAPAFTRAGMARLGDSRYLLISGTASIVGHTTQHPEDIEAQAREALANIAAVIEAAAPAMGGRRSIADLQCIKSYLRDPADAAPVEAILAERLPGVPRLLLHAPLCRTDLLVEFEAQLALE